MDTKTLIADVKARFNHNTAKAYLKDKYSSKLTVASHGGLWRAGPEIISFLNCVQDETVILIDTFDNPVKVNRVELRDKLLETYSTAMNQWHDEWVDLEKKR